MLAVAMFAIATANAQWSLTGNSISSGNFLGTTNNQNLVFKANGQPSGLIDVSGSTANTFFGYGNGGTIGAGNAGNVAIGFFALRSNTANANTAVGYEALYTNTTGSSNNAFGSGALWSNTSGQQNSGLGLNCLFHNTTGSSNSASGAFALFSNTTASGNTANGYQSLYSNTTGNNNNAFGSGALYSVTTAVNNCAFGTSALSSNSTGYGNIAIGFAALSNTTFDHNVAVGDQALYSSNAAQNVAVGSSAGYNISIGNANTAIGDNALNGVTTGQNNTALGRLSGSSLVSGGNSTFVGSFADASSSSLTNAGAFGYGAIVNASNKIRIGNTSITVIEGQVSFTPSDGRFKTSIKNEVKGLTFINKLNPVVYNLSARKFDEFLMKDIKKSKRDSILNLNDYTDAENMRRTGFIAQEVEQAAKESGYVFDGLHVPKNDNDNYSLSYALFVVPLVKAVQELSAANDSLKNQLTELTQRIDAIELAQNKNSNASLQSSTSSDAISVNTAGSLEQNSPNPFNSNTIIRYSIPANIGNAKIIVTDISGSIVKEFSIANKGAGQVTINAGTLSSGSYIYSLFLNNKKIQSKQMILTK